MKNENMDPLLKNYLARASEIIGERSPGEIVHDSVVLKELRIGRTIKYALKIAGKKFPEEVLQWDESNIKDIAAHYDYMLKHEEIMKKLRSHSG